MEKNIIYSARKIFQCNLKAELCFKKQIIKLFLSSLTVLKFQAVSISLILL